MVMFRKLPMVAVILSLLAEPALALNCAAPKLESEALLCQADQIRARRVGTVVGGALAGALLGNLLTQGGGGAKTRASLAGAMAGGLAGYWLSVSNEIKAKAASDTARAAEVKARIKTEAKRQRASAANLNKELKVTLLRSPSTAEDAKKREAELAQIAKAANLGIQQANDAGTGYTQVAGDLGASYDARPTFNAPAQDFDKTRRQACAEMTHPGAYCS